MAITKLTFSDPYSWHTQEEWDYLEKMSRIIDRHVEEASDLFTKAYEDMFFYGRGQFQWP